MIDSLASTLLCTLLTKGVMCGFWLVKLLELKQAHNAAICDSPGAVLLTRRKTAVYTLALQSATAS